MTRNPPRLLLDQRNPRVRLPRKKLFSCLNWVLRHHAPGKRLEVVFVGSREMRKINKMWHQSDTVTDVLAFPYDQDLLGEVIVCTDVAQKQSRLRNLSQTSEIMLYAVHGTLHLLGYDDHSSKSSLKMRQKEVSILNCFELSTDRLESLA